SQLGCMCASHRKRAGTVAMNTIFGGTRIVDMLIGEQLPRIC
ncbi:MAG: hydrogenase expression/formation protein HypE, partial [Pseudomonadota bacterium]|nr:hydrogenase expression/formation protein HypE [Pseudomonadota bacterium]